MSIFDYPRWKFFPSSRHATIYPSAISQDVITFGYAGQRPMVKWTGFEDFEGADATVIRQLATAQKLMINHVSRALRIGANHSGSLDLSKIEHDFRDKRNYYRVPIYLRAPADKQKWIEVCIWSEGMYAVVPPLAWDLWDKRNISTMAQFEHVCFKVSALMLDWQREIAI